MNMIPQVLPWGLFPCSLVRSFRFFAVPFLASLNDYDSPSVTLGQFPTRLHYSSHFWAEQYYSGILNSPSVTLGIMLFYTRVYLSPPYSYVLRYEYYCRRFLSDLFFSNLRISCPLSAFHH